MKTSLRQAPSVLAALTACAFAADRSEAQVIGRSPVTTSKALETPQAGSSDRIKDFASRSNLGRTAYYAAVPIWAGLYVGGHAAYSWGSFEANRSDLGSSRIGGGLAGLHVGYNWQNGDFVAGVEGDYAAAWIDGHRTFASGLDMTGKADWTSSLRVRLGYSFSNVMLYATGGLAVGKFSATVSDGVTSFSGSNMHTGYVVGGGIETKFSPSISARAEVLHYGFGEKDYAFGSVVAPIRSDETVVRGGISIHFN